MRFEALELSLQLIRKLRPIVAIIQTHDRKLAEQVRTAASSSSLNLAEGNRSAGKDKPPEKTIATSGASPPEAPTKPEHPSESPKPGATSAHAR